MFAEIAAAVVLCRAPPTGEANAGIVMLEAWLGCYWRRRARNIQYNEGKRLVPAMQKVVDVYSVVVVDWAA